MQIPKNLILTSEDIRYLRPSQLAMLTAIDASSFSAWDNHRRMSERTLERIAPRLGMNKIDLVCGFDLRRKDAAIARTVQTKADQLIAFLRLQEQETA